MARPLATAFETRGMTYWLDRIDLPPAQAIEDDILAGILAARYAVVIISRSFLQKEWPKRELDIFLALEEIDQRRKIVTVRHEVTESELRKLAPYIAERTSISSEKGPSWVCDQVIELSREYERTPLRRSDGEAIASLFPTFHGNGVFTCANPNCTWRPHPYAERVGLGNQAGKFTLKQQNGEWHVSCTTCGSVVFGPVAKDRAKWLLTFLRMNIWGPEVSPYLNPSFLSNEYLHHRGKELAITRGALAAVSRGDSIEEWLSARQAYEREIELSMNFGKLSRQQYEELSSINRKHADELRTAQASGEASTSLEAVNFRGASPPEEHLFPASDRQRIERDIATLSNLPPAVRGDLAADLGERINKFLSALNALNEHPDRPVAQLYIGSLYYWNCVRVALAGSEDERLVMNSQRYTTANGDVITGYFSIAEYFLNLFRSANVGGPAEQALADGVESWMRAIRAGKRVMREMQMWVANQSLRSK